MKNFSPSMSFVNLWIKTLLFPVPTAARIILLLTYSISIFSSCAKDPNTLKSEMIRALEEGNCKKMQSLLKQGISPNLYVDEKTSLLHLAVYKKNVEAVKTLVEAGADITILDEDRNAPLTTAVVLNDFDTVVYLVEQGADVNYINNNKNKSTALMEAARYNYIKIISYLVENGADLNTVGHMGFTAMGFAAGVGSFEAVKFLYEAGTDPNILGNWGPGDMNTLDLAIYNEQTKVIAYLKEQGMTPLYHAKDKNQQKK